VQREQLLHGHAGAADLDRDLHGDVPEQVEAAALAPGVRQGDLQREGGLVLAVGHERDRDEHALVAQPVEGRDRLLHALGGDPDPAKRGGRGLERRTQRGGDVHLPDGGVLERVDHIGRHHEDDVAADLAGQAGGHGRGRRRRERDAVRVADRRAGDQGDRGGHQSGGCPCGRRDDRRDGLGVLGGGGGGHAVSFAAAVFGVGTMAAASRRRWLLAIA
jgi:hypothetical protein